MVWRFAASIDMLSIYRLSCMAPRHGSHSQQFRHRFGHLAIETAAESELMKEAVHSRLPLCGKAVSDLLNQHGRGPKNRFLILPVRIYTRPPERYFDTLVLE